MSPQGANVTFSSFVVLNGPSLRRIESLYLTQKCSFKMSSFLEISSSHIITVMLERMSLFLPYNNNCARKFEPLPPISQQLC